MPRIRVSGRHMKFPAWMEHDKEALGRRAAAYPHKRIPFKTTKIHTQNGDCHYGVLSKRKHTHPSPAVLPSLDRRPDHKSAPKMKIRLSGPHLFVAFCALEQHKHIILPLPRLGASGLPREMLKEDMVLPGKQTWVCL